MDEKYAKNLLDKTQENYSRIAGHFSKTRDCAPQELKYLGRFASDSQKILDVGCGTGRLLKLFEKKDIEYVGMDNSEKLIETAKESQKSKVQSQNYKSKFKNIEFMVADALNLPFPDNYFDRVFSIAVLHHIPSKKFRQRFLQEARRVLKPKGFLILTVWNFWPTRAILNIFRSHLNKHQRQSLKYQKRFLNYHIKYFLLKIFRHSRLDFKDIFYPWKNPKGKILAQRYIHCFSKQELKGLVKKAKFRVSEIGFLDKNKKNIYAVAKKD